MTEAPPRQPAAPPRELRRSGEGRILMGVCAGLGRHTGIDPVVFRVAFAVLLLGSGIGLFLYLAAFLLMKEPNGRPGIIEQWTRRDFDAETVMALLTAVLGFGLAINLATVWLDAGSLVVAMFLAVSLLAAHSSGVDLLGLARSMPERLMRRQGAPAAFYEGPAPASPSRPRAPALLSPPRKPPMSRIPRMSRTSRICRTFRMCPLPGSVPPSAPPSPARWRLRPTCPRPQSLRRPSCRGSRPRTTRPRVRRRRPWPRPCRRPSRSCGRPPRAYATRPTRPGRPARASGAMTGAMTGVPPEAVTAQHASPSYQPTQPTQPTRQERAYRPDPPTAVDYTRQGEPFAPNGPYRPLDPARQASHAGHGPYDPALYFRPIPRRERARRPKSYIGAITILLAIIIGGIVVAVQARSAAGVSPTIVGGAMLITIGAGLLVAAWWGRGAGLVAAGTALVLIVGMGLMLGGVPRNLGSVEWVPTSVAEAGQVYDVGLGDGRLDLSELKLPPGTRVTFSAAISAGELEVIVPSTARVEVHASNKVGDIVIGPSLTGGVDVRVNKVMEPEVEPEGKVSTIVLNLKGGLGDMEVRSAA
ncbi:PspC domain-containing protein [Nonomuraea antimicrobica]